MTPEERERLGVLVQRLQTEQNYGKFVELVTRLNELLELKERRLHERRRPHLCAICGKPVDLTTCKTDADGRAVHSQCINGKIIDGSR